MPKITLNTIVTGFNLANINQNFSDIQTFINEEALSRSNPTESTNNLQVDIDANSNRILNLPTPTQNTEAATKAYVDALILSDPGSVTTVEEQFTATSGQTVFNLGATYTPGSGNIDVYVNGVHQDTSAYSETDNNTITFGTGVETGDSVFIKINQRTASSDTYAASNVTYQSTGASSVQTNVQDRLREVPTVGDYGAASDGVTDDTSVILTAAVDHDQLVIPYNTKYDPQTLMATLPDDTVLLDFSQINSFSASGEATKEVGISSKDSASDDTHWRVGSGHHSIIQLNNNGAAGTTSATERKATLLWASGYLEEGSSDKLGWRGAAMKQYTKETGATYWIESLRSLAPWVAIAADYERWVTGQTISGSGVYRVNGSNHYVSTGAGTTGATAPTHTTGTVSDGGVSWTWVDSADRTVYSIDEYGRVLIGNGTAGNTFFHKVSPTDPSGDYVAILEARGASKNVTVKLNPTDSGSSVTAVPYIRAKDGCLQIIKSDGTTTIFDITDDEGLKVKEEVSYWTAAVDGDTSPSVSGIATLYTANTGATSITALDDGSDGQRVKLVITDANTTLVHSSTFMLEGSTNVTTPAAYSAFIFEKVPSTISDRWIEVGRSVK